MNMNISNAFTIEDIHNIRYENYEQTKKLLPIELIEKTKKEASLGWIRLAEIRQEEKAQYVL
jgi:predicted MarR family transcription regulator